MIYQTLRLIVNHHFLWVPHCTRLAGINQDHVGPFPLLGHHAGGDVFRSKCLSYMESCAS